MRSSSVPNPERPRPGARRRAAASGKAEKIRTSQILREILTKNPEAETFTVEHIVTSIGNRGVAQPLMLFSIPGILPVPETATLSGIPAGALASHMITGRKEIELPRFVRERSVPRRSLAVAIHAILPVLERVEKVTKKRWLWASHPVAQRMLGILVFLLALVVAFPILGFTLPHSAAIFTISLGVAEQDGLAILIGVAAGIAALVLMFGTSLSARVLKSKALSWLRSTGRRLGLKTAAKFLSRRGISWGKMLELDWNHLLLIWNPEARDQASRTKGEKAGARKSSRQKAAALPGATSTGKVLKRAAAIEASVVPV